MMNFKFLCGFVLCIVAVNVYGQNFKPGTIVTKSGKTINCIIQNIYTEDYIFHDKVRYRLGEKEKTKTIDKDSIQEMKVKGETFESVNISDDSTKVKMDLLWLLVDGSVKYYMGVKFHMYGMVGGPGAIPMGGRQKAKCHYLKRGNDPVWWYSFSWSRRDLKEYFKDDPELAGKIGTKYFENNVKEIVQEYNSRHPLQK
jgi:hypothetical protein